MDLFGDCWNGWQVDKAFCVDSIRDWTDPYPDPIIEEHEGFKIVRDDFLGYGSKIRFIDHLVKTVPQDEIVFGSCPATGYAQISLPYVCNRYGKKAVLFMAKRNMDNLHEYQKRGIELGVNYHWVPDGMLAVTQKRAKDYAAENPEKRLLFPLGLEHMTVIGSIIKVAQSLPTPKEFWTVGSSGTLNRGLQLAWPRAKACVVSVGHGMNQREIGRAIYFKSPYKFDKPCKKVELPPFPSAPTYDSKCWSFMKKYGSPGALMWNVGA